MKKITTIFGAKNGKMNKEKETERLRKMKARKCSHSRCLFLLVTKKYIVLA